jgi:hypothetical protein
MKQQWGTVVIIISHENALEDSADCPLAEAIINIDVGKRGGRGAGRG